MGHSELDGTRADRTQTVYLVDAFSLIFQVFHALPEMTGPDGQPVAAIHGFMRDLLDLLEKKRPDFLACAFDCPGGTFRDELYPEYKAGRAEMPADLQAQIPRIRQVIAALGIPAVELAGYEADDVLATLARRAERAGYACYLVSSDKDLRQLITDRIKLYNLRRDQVFDAAALWEEWGVRADQVVDFQALVGDSVDNVPGIPLIGPKIARDLLGKYQTLDNVLDHAGEIAGPARRENLLNGRQTALLSRTLVALVDDLPLELDWDAARPRPFDLAAVERLCREFDFRRMIERVRRVRTSLGPPDSATPAAETSGRADLVDSPAVAAASAAPDEIPATPPGPLPAEGPVRPVCHIVATAQDFTHFIERLSQQRQIALHVETNASNPRWAEVVGYAFAWQPNEAYYIPIRAPAGDPTLGPELVHAALRPILEDPRIEKVGHDLKRALVVLRSVDIHVRGAAFDTMVAAYLLDPGERTHGLGNLAKRHLGYVAVKIDQVLGVGKSRSRMDQAPTALAAARAVERVDLPLRIGDALGPRLHADGLMPLFRDLEMPLIDVLAEMEFNGIAVDRRALERSGERFATRMEQLAREIHQLAGGDFNINSPAQLAKVLFTDLGLPPGKQTKTGASTDVGVLEKLAELHPLPAKVIEYRHYGKLCSTYVDSLLGLIHPRTGRIHTSFRQDVAATGRLSSTEPNLQNIPARTEDGRQIRAAFVAGEPGWKLIAADYSQIELRILAHFSGDRALQQAFAADEDIHATVASQIYGVPLSQVTRAQRQAAKAVNFGVIYGQSPFGLAKALNIEKAQAAEFIDAYFARYPGVEDFIQRTLAECRKNGYVKTILGRRRAVRGIRDLSSIGDSRQRNLPERIAINTVIQGSAADLIKRAMIQVHGGMKHDKLRARLLLQIHDELVLEAPSEEIEPLARLVRREMESAERLTVALRADVKVGANWADCEPWP